MDILHCPHCGKELPPEMQFCPYCMERITEPAAVSADELRPTKQWKKPNKTTVLLTSIALCAVAAVSLGVGLFRHAQAKNNLPTVSPESGAYTETAPTNENGEPIPTAPTEKSKIGSLFSNIFSADDKTDANTPADSNTGIGNAAQGGSPSNPSGTGSGTNAPVGSTPPTSPASSDGTSAGGSVNTDPCANGHTWAPVTETVHHDEVGHYEAVEHQQTVTKYKCPVCYEKFASLDAYYAHFDSVHMPSYSGDPIRAFRNQYKSVSDTETYTTNEWVVDKAAYDETVIVGYTCSVCGAKQ
ncbi:MAG: zinc ribbon domain-containing protein [Clostridia bacterium]|nr:zinc ribbon domain-containing protein [Clostridia bacterium]